MREKAASKMFVYAAAAAVFALACTMPQALGDGDGDSDSGHLNPYRSRGASLLYTQTTPYGGPSPVESDPQGRAYPYFYDDQSPLPLHLRRQRQFVPERFQEPIVVPRANAHFHQGQQQQTRPRVEIKELPPINTMSPQARRLFLSQLFSPRAAPQQAQPPQTRSVIS